MKSIKVNFIYNSIYQILVIILPIITMPYVSRMLGVESVGIYSYTQSIAYYFVMIAMLGVGNYGNRTCAIYSNDKDKLSKEFISIYIFQVIVSTIAIIAYIIYITKFDIKYNLLGKIQIIYVASAMFDVSWFFAGIEEFKLITIRNAIVKITTVILILLLVKNEGDLWIYTLIMSSGVFISQIIIWPFINRYINFKKPKLKEIIKHIKPNLILFIPVLAVSLYKIMDKIMIGALSDMIQGGYYSNAEKIISLPTIIISSLGTVMLPRMSNLIANDKMNMAREYIKNSMFFVLYFSIAFTFGLIGISPNFVPIFFGNDFVECIKLITFMSPIIIFIGWSNVIRTQYLIPNSRDREYIVSVALGAVANLSINIILIPSCGALGAVIGTLGAELCVSMVQTIYIKDELPVKEYIRESLVFIPIGFTMAIIIRFLGNISMNKIILLILQIICGGTFYVLVSLNIIFKYNEKIKSMITKNFKFLKFT